MTIHMNPVFGTDLLDFAPIRDLKIPSDIDTLDFEGVNSMSPTFGVEFLLKVRAVTSNKVKIINVAPHLSAGLKKVIEVL
jgi:hypothetical protein